MPRPIRGPDDEIFVLFDRITANLQNLEGIAALCQRYLTDDHVAAGNIPGAPRLDRLETIFGQQIFEYRIWAMIDIMHMCSDDCDSLLRLRIPQREYILFLDIEDRIRWWRQAIIADFDNWVSWSMVEALAG